MMAIQLSEDRISFTPRRNSIIDGLHELPKQILQILQHDREFQALARSTLVKERSLLIMVRSSPPSVSTFRNRADAKFEYRVVGTNTRRAWRRR